jgi:TonB family protein
MMPAINGIVLAVSNSLAASILAKATIATALGLTVTWMAYRSRAAVRHTLLAAVFGVLLVLPIASLLAPPVLIAVRAAVQQRAVPSHAAVTEIGPPLAPGLPDAAVPRPARVSASTLLLAAWIAGMCLFLLPAAMGLWQVRRLRRSALPWGHGQSIMASLALEAGIRRRVDLLLNNAVPGPMTCGVLHPAIVLPQGAEHWDDQELIRALVHELEHVRRVDWVSLCLARAVCAMYWFHPLVWIAWRKLALEAERSCDDAVLGRSEATAYADQLVELARRLSAQPAMLAMANRADLAKRVGAVLDGRQQRGRAGKPSVALACVVAALLVLGLSPLKVVAAPQDASAGAGTASVVFTSTTRLVLVDVVAKFVNGEAIEGLRRDDFTVTEDGRRQMIEVFEPQKLGSGSLPSYYILGYYSSNLTRDGQYRKVLVMRNGDSASNLEFKSGYYAELSSRVNPPATAQVRPANNASGTRPPIPINRPQPQYSEEARKAKWGGTVLLDVDIDATGKVVSVTVAKPLGRGLDEKAIQAATKWTFMPALKDGKPVSAQVQLQMNFSLL